MSEEKEKDSEKLKKATEESNSEETKNQKGNKEYPGYPLYPKSEDIYSQSIELDLNAGEPNISQNEVDNLGERNELDFSEDMTGEDLDVPGSQDDEALPNFGKEDEENNYYSLGGDNHNDLEEDNG